MPLSPLQAERLAKFDLQGPGIPQRGSDEVLVAASPKKFGKRNPPNRRTVRHGPPWLGELFSRLGIHTSQSQGCLRSTWTACSPLPLSVASLLARGLPESSLAASCGTKAAAGCRSPKITPPSSGLPQSKNHPAKRHAAYDEIYFE